MMPNLEDDEKKRRNLIRHLFVFFSIFSNYRKEKRDEVKKVIFFSSLFLQSEYSADENISVKNEAKNRKKRYIETFEWSPYSKGDFHVILHHLIEYIITFLLND